MGTDVTAPLTFADAAAVLFPYSSENTLMVGETAETLNTSAEMPLIMRLYVFFILLSLSNFA